MHTANPIIPNTLYPVDTIFPNPKNDVQNDIKIPKYPYFLPAMSAMQKAEQAAVVYIAENSTNPHKTPPPTAEKSGISKSLNPFVKKHTAAVSGAITANKTAETAKGFSVFIFLSKIGNEIKLYPA